MLLRSAVYGFIIGDALGVPHEFKIRGTYACETMTNGGVWNQPVGTWSDDTSMLLATLDSINHENGINIKDMRNRFLDWMHHAKYTARNETFDIGLTTQQALMDGIGKSNVRSNGNGSLMRILPLAFIDCDDKKVKEVSSITHAHDISKKACLIYVDIVRRLIKNENLKDILNNQTHEEPFTRLNSLHELAESEIKSTGYVVDTLEAALWCVLQSHSYKETVLKAINLGGDTDTIAAIAGGLAGIIYGYDAIPKEWIDTLHNKELITAILLKQKLE